MQVAISPDGRHMVTAGDGVARWGGTGQLTIWDATSWRPLRSLTGHDLVIMSIASSPDGHLLTGSLDGVAKLWDVTTGQELLQLRGHTSGISGVAVSPDGTRLATASNDRTVKLWDAETGAQQFTLYGHDESVHAAAFSPDGRLLASSSPDGMVTCICSRPTNCWRSPAPA